MCLYLAWPPLLMEMMNEEMVEEYTTSRFQDPITRSTTNIQTTRKLLYTNFAWVPTVHKKLKSTVKCQKENKLHSATSFTHQKLGIHYMPLNTFD